MILTSERYEEIAEKLRRHFSKGAEELSEDLGIKIFGTEGDGTLCAINLPIFFSPMGQSKLAEKIDVPMDELRQWAKEYNEKSLMREA